MSPNVLTSNQISFYGKHGYLHLNSVYDDAELQAMTDDLDWQIDEWAGTGPGWSGNWRQAYMSPDIEKRSKLTALHDLHRYSKAWCDAVTHSTLTGAIADLIGPNVELHHTTLHAKPPETGHPFPMHQDWPFYRHSNGSYIDCLVHLDDTSDQNGCIRFLDRSHRYGALQHVLQFQDGSPCTPHLPTEDWHLEDTDPVPAKRGDVVLFNIHTIHGSRINQTNEIRRLVRVGYRDPTNKQLGGQSMSRPGLMVWGRRPRLNGQVPYSTEV
ncbi:MAG: phytanoyl-CoA dioxygenase family protein [Gammaproteobacteria bacterium]|nr:phytanoyl-CoA dioxygenase family protein [Gammaproteobacteria bacterium]